MKIIDENKNKIDLVIKYNELNTYASINKKDDYYYNQVSIYNNNRTIVQQQEPVFLTEKSNLVTHFYEELKEFQREHLEHLIYNEIKIKNTLYSNDQLSLVNKD